MVPITVEDLLFVVVLGLDGLVPDLEPPAKSLSGGFTGPSGSPPDVASGARRLDAVSTVDLIAQLAGHGA